MPKFITIGYGDEAGYERTSPTVRNAAHAHDEKLKREGAILGIAGPPVQVRNPEGNGTITSHGAFLSADLPVAGFGLIEAKDFAEAIDKVSKSPCAVAHGVVEVWPITES